jgi:hypothetical protein
MAGLLFTTEDMRTAAEQMARAAGGLVERIPAIFPTGVLMPPSLEMEATEAAVSVSAEITQSSAFYGYNAADLATRAAIVIAENEGGAIAGAMSSYFGTELRSVLQWARYASGPVGFGFGSSGLKSLLGDLRGIDENWLSELFQEGEGVVETMISVVKYTPDLLSTYGVGLQALETSGPFEVMSGAAKGLGYLNMFLGTVQGWDDTAGETLAGRVFTTYANGLSSLAVAEDPYLAGANLFSLGAVGDDFHFISDIAGAFISGNDRGGLSQGMSDANAMLTADANRLANSNSLADWPMKQVARAVNWVANEAYAPTTWPMKQLDNGVSWVVNETYAPVSNVIGHVASAVTSTASTVGHLAGSAAHGVSDVTSRGIKDIESII